MSLMYHAHWYTDPAWLPLTHERTLTLSYGKLTSDNKLTHCPWEMRQLIEVLFSNLFHRRVAWALPANLFSVKYQGRVRFRFRVARAIAVGCWYSLVYQECEKSYAASVPGSTSRVPRYASIVQLICQWVTTTHVLLYLVFVCVCVYIILT